MMFASRAFRTLALVAGTVTLLAAPVGAQAPASTLTGQVLDPSGKPVADQHVTLHRVDQFTGEMVDSAVTNVQGRFTVQVPAVQDTNSIFFVATRWQGQLYIGAPFKPPIPAQAAYVVNVGVNPVQMSATDQGTTGAGEAPATSAPGSSGAARWFLAVVLGLVALGAVAYALLGSARERSARQRRALLVRIADLDERADRADAEEAAALRRERAELLAQLTSD